jgi:sec-independent protein translocase protein TatB
VFDVGFWELTFIMTLALLVLGPDKLPGVVRSLGRWMGRARSVARNLRVQIEREVAEIPGAPVSRSTNPKPPPAQAAAEPEKKPAEPPVDAVSADPQPTTATDGSTAEKSSEPGTRF